MKQLVKQIETLPKLKKELKVQQEYIKNLMDELEIKLRLLYRQKLNNEITEKEYTQKKKEVVNEFYLYRVEIDKTINEIQKKITKIEIKKDRGY